MHFKAHLADAFCTTRRLHPATRRSQFDNRPISASAFAPWCAHRCSSECPERFLHHSSLPFRIKTIAKTPPPITAAAITATIHHGKENLSLSTGELCSVFFSWSSFETSGQFRKLDVRSGTERFYPEQEHTDFLSDCDSSICPDVGYGNNRTSAGSLPGYRRRHLV